MITVEKAVEILSKHMSHGFGDRSYGPGFVTVAEIVELLKEKESVVRCKDCRYGRMINILNYTCTESQNHCEHILHSPDWFCADGKKKRVRSGSGR